MGWRLQREGIVRTWKRKRPNEGHSPLETAEGGICQDMIRKRLSKALVQVHRGAGMLEAFREHWGAYIPVVV
jgi:hypothetical protein